MIIYYGLIGLEAIMIIVLFAKIHDVYSRIELMSSLNHELRGNYIRLLDTWQQCVDNSGELIAVAEDIITLNKELSMRLKDAEENKNER